MILHTYTLFIFLLLFYTNYTRKRYFVSLLFFTKIKKNEGVTLKNNE